MKQILPVDELSEAGYPAYLHGFSAIDSYLGRENAVAAHVLCGAGLADLARLFEDLRYPGAVLADAAVDREGKTWYFHCEDAADAEYPRDLRRNRSTFRFLEFYQDCKNKRFYDLNNIYSILRFIRDGKNDDDSSCAGIAGDWHEEPNPGVEPSRALIDCALILAHYFPDVASRGINSISEKFRGSGGFSPPGIEEQRLLLAGLLGAANPGPGFELLKKSGFIAAYWPELAALDDVDHSKEFHPEGNVWKHTLETFRYRKPGANGVFDLCLSLGLLLHDTGKPIAASFGNHRFDGHAELGARAAARFLERLEFNPSLVQDVFFLVKNHMLPAALKRLPIARTGETMASPLFPLLMELYRCDESSSFKGLDGYYENSAAYQSYLRNVKNPYRTADGKKTNRNAILLGKK